MRAVSGSIADRKLYEAGSAAVLAYLLEARACWDQVWVYYLKRYGGRRDVVEVNIHLAKISGSIKVEFVDLPEALQFVGALNITDPTPNTTEMYRTIWERVKATKLNEEANTDE